MHILRTSFSGSPNVGLFGYATESYVLLGEHLDEKKLADVTEVLGNVPVHNVTIAGTGMPGVFLAGNANGVLAPAILFDHEREALEQLDIPVTTLDTTHTCLGNNVVCNEHGAVVSPLFNQKEVKQMEKALGVPVVQTTIAGLDSPGAFLLVNGEQGVVHRDVTAEERALIEKALHVTLEPATVNLGTPYLRAAVMHNAHGFVIGEQSGGPEIVHIDQALGYDDA